MLWQGPKREHAFCWFWTDEGNVKAMPWSTLGHGQGNAFTCRSSKSFSQGGVDDGDLVHHSQELISTPAEKGTRASAYQGICSTPGTSRETKHHRAGGKAVTPIPQDPRGPSRRVKRPLTGRWAPGTLWHGIRR